MRLAKRFNLREEHKVAELDDMEQELRVFGNGDRHRSRSKTYSSRDVMIPSGAH